MMNRDNNAKSEISKRHLKMDSIYENLLKIESMVDRFDERIRGVNGRIVGQQENPPLSPANNTPVPPGLISLIEFTIERISRKIDSSGESFSAIESI